MRLIEPQLELLKDDPGGGCFSAVVAVIIISVTLFIAWKTGLIK